MYPDLCSPMFIQSRGKEGNSLRGGSPPSPTSATQVPSLAGLPPPIPQQQASDGDGKAGSTNPLAAAGDRTSPRHSLELGSLLSTPVSSREPGRHRILEAQTGGTKSQDHPGCPRNPRAWVSKCGSTGPWSLGLSAKDLGGHRLALICGPEYSGSTGPGDAAQGSPAPGDPHVQLAEP